MNTNKDTISLYLKSFVPNMSKESIETYRALTTKKNISKGEILLEPDVLTYKCYIIESGFAGSFLRQEDGSHFIRTIFKELTSFGSPQCLFSNTKNTTEYRTLTDCVVYELDYMKFKKINNPEFLQFQINTLKKVYLYSEKRINELSSFNATQLYIQIKKEFPNIDNILPQYQIANYLNITPIQLSRIRKKMLVS